MPAPSRVPDRPHGAFRPREYAHIVFRTRNPERLIAWYCTVLGMQVVVRHWIISFLTWDDSQDRLAIINDPEALPHTEGREGLDHAAYALDSIGALTTQYSRLKALGILPYRCMNHGVSTSMYYRDPDGNQIELTVDHFGGAEALNAWLAGGDFDANPIGVPIDPDELCARVTSGEHEESLRRPHPEHREWLPRILAARGK